MKTLFLLDISLFFLISIYCDNDDSVKNIIRDLRKLQIHCDKGFYLNGNSCFACFENCLDCDGIKCNQCEDGYYPNQMNCYKCYPNCLKCDGIKCTQCEDGYYPNDMDCYKCYSNCIDCDGIKCNKCTKGNYPVNVLLFLHYSIFLIDYHICY